MAGLDEAGRGCLAGPVVAAAVILPPLFDLPGLTDSKACTARTRERLAPRIRQCATAWGLGVVWPARIDRINILQATFEAMCRLCAACATLRLCFASTATTRCRRPCWLPIGSGATARTRPCRASRPLCAAMPACRPFPPHPFWPKPTGTPSWRTWTAAGRATVLPRTKGYGTKEHLAALRRLAPAPSTG